MKQGNKIWVVCLCSAPVRRLHTIAIGRAFNGLFDSSLFKYVWMHPSSFTSDLTDLSRSVKLWQSGCSSSTMAPKSCQNWFKRKPALRFWKCFWVKFNRKCFNGCYKLCHKWLNNPLERWQQKVRVLYFHFSQILFSMYVYVILTSWGSEKIYIKLKLVH